MRKVHIAIVLALSVPPLLVGLAFVLVFLGDPRFPPLTAPEEVVSTETRHEQRHFAPLQEFKMPDGVKLSAQRLQGTIPITVVLVHGVLSNNLEMTQTAALLQNITHGTVVSLDLRGHGRSGGTPGDVDHIGQYEEDLAEVLRQLKNLHPQNKTVLAGHSMGGGIVLRYTQRNLQPQADAFLLFAPHLGSASPTTPRESTPASQAFVQVHVWRTLGLQTFNAVGYRGFNGLRTLFFNLPAQFPLRSYTYRAVASMAPDDHRKALRNIHQPLLVLVGAQDEAFVANRYETVIKAYSKGEVQVIPDTTHNGILTAAQGFEHVRAWWETLRW